MQNKKYHLKRLKNELLSQSLKSDSDNTYGYTEIVTAAVNDEDTFSNFRNNQQYKEILSHVSKQLAEKYYQNIRNSLSHKEVIDICKRVNNFGNPQKFLINGYSFCPSSLRYLNVALDVSEKFIDKEIKNIVEIGAGYGGQALILESFFEIETYTFIDLQIVNSLIEKFINLHSYNFEPYFYTIENFNKNILFDLSISNYAFSELPKNLQKLALEKFINNSNNGYMLVNNFNDLSFRYLTKTGYQKNILKKIKIEDEIPESYPFNKLLYF